MKFDIAEIEELSGSGGRVYSVFVGDDDETLFDKFLAENAQLPETQEMLNRIRAMAESTGFLRQFFKEGEGALADGVVALRVGQLRLYGIYFNSSVILFGSGGWKPRHARAYQDDAALCARAQEVREIAREINKGICGGQIRINSDGTLDDTNFETYD